APREPSSLRDCVSSTIASAMSPSEPGPLTTKTRTTRQQDGCSGCGRRFKEGLLFQSGQRVARGTGKKAGNGPKAFEQAFARRASEELHDGGQHSSLRVGLTQILSN